LTGIKLTEIKLTEIGECASRSFRCGPPPGRSATHMWELARGGGRGFRRFSDGRRPGWL